MKKYEVNMDLTITVTVEVEAENEEQAGQLAIEKVGNDEGYYVRKYDSLLEREVTEVHEAEEEQPEPMTFNELVDKLDYFSVDDNQTKTIFEICDECREYIRKHGHSCLDECIDEDSEAKEWFMEHHPEMDTVDFDWSSALSNPIEFLCRDECTGDVAIAELYVDFYGDWGQGIGVFSVYH